MVFVLKKCHLLDGFWERQDYHPMRNKITCYWYSMLIVTTYLSDIVPECVKILWNMNLKYFEWSLKKWKKCRFFYAIFPKIWLPLVTSQNSTFPKILVTSGYLREENIWIFGNIRFVPPRHFLVFKVFLRSQVAQVMYCKYKLIVQSLFLMRFWFLLHFNYMLCRNKEKLNHNVKYLRIIIMFSLFCHKLPSPPNQRF